MPLHYHVKHPIFAGSLIGSWILSYDEESTNTDMFVSMLPLLFHNVSVRCMFTKI